jgi:hypothetical protein
MVPSGHLSVLIVWSVAALRWLVLSQVQLDSSLTQESNTVYRLLMAGIDIGGA